MSNITTIFVAIFASTGLWSLIMYTVQRKDNKGDMLRGLAHDRIIYLGGKYIERGYITPDEFENLHDYLFVPYTQLGGNGTVKKVMDDVKKLPLIKERKV